MKAIIEWLRLLVKAPERAQNNEERLDALEEKILGIQAIDESWHDTGKIILMFHTENRDIVKIIDVHKKTTVKDYEVLARSLEAQYGTRTEYFDNVRGTRGFIF